MLFRPQDLIYLYECHGERWPSGLRRTPGKRVGCKLSQVRILSSPPYILMNILDQPFVFLDVETTGLSPAQGARVLEIGALRMEQGVITKTMNTLVHPECDVPYFITNITGIRDEDINTAPLFHEISDELKELMDGAIFIAHNVNFDYSFISHEYERLGEKFTYPKLCTVRLSRALFPDIRSHKLENIIQRHNYRVNARHRAFDDAEVLQRFVTDMLELDYDRTHQAMQKLLTSS